MGLVRQRRRRGVEHGSCRYRVETRRFLEIHDLRGQNALHREEPRLDEGIRLVVPDTGNAGQILDGLRYLLFKANISFVLLNVNLEPKQLRGQPMLAVRQGTMVIRSTTCSAITRIPRMPTHAPTGSTFGSCDTTAIFVR